MGFVKLVLLTVLMALNTAPDCISGGRGFKVHYWKSVASAPWIAVPWVTATQYAGGVPRMWSLPFPFLFSLLNGAIRPNTGADDTCISGMATYSENSEYMAVLTHRIVSHEEITGESLIIKVT